MNQQKKAVVVITIIIVKTQKFQTRLSNKATLNSQDTLDTETTRPIKERKTLIENQHQD